MLFSKKKSIADTCIFCRILRGEIPADVVYESDLVIAIEDINPQADEHVLVIAKKHIENLNDLGAEDKELVYELHVAMQESAKKLGFYEKGYRVIHNCGKEAGQTISHLHYHVVHNKDGMKKSII